MGHAEVGTPLRRAGALAGVAAAVMLCHNAAYGVALMPVAAANSAAATGRLYR